MLEMNGAGAPKSLEAEMVERELCGLMTKFQYKDDFFGESNSALAPTMDLIHTQDQGIKEAIKNGATFRFMAKLNNFSKPEDLAKERKRFSRENFEAEDGGGLLLFPNTYADIQQIKSTPFTVDADQMNAIKENVFNYFGVNEEVLQNKATDEQLDSFFNGAIEPFSIQLSQVLEKMLFTNREISIGNHVYVAANRLQYMSTTHKINMAQQLGDRGMITINEVRELFNYPPLLEGGDKAPIRGEYYFAGEEKTDGKDGYDAALVTAEDGTNYIYMYLPDEKMAKSVLTDSDGDQEADPGLKLISRKNGYELYIQESAAADSSDSDFPMYGKCLLAGRMIIIVNGTQDNKKQIIENADRFLKNLGFNP